MFMILFWIVVGPMLVIAVCVAWLGLLAAIWKAIVER